MRAPASGHRRRCAAAAAALVVVLGGCSSGRDTPAPPTPSSTPSSASSPGSTSPSAPSNTAAVPAPPASSPTSPPPASPGGPPETTAAPPPPPPPPTPPPSSPAPTAAAPAPPDCVGVTPLDVRGALGATTAEVALRDGACIYTSDAGTVTVQGGAPGSVAERRSAAGAGAVDEADFGPDAFSTVTGTTAVLTFGRAATVVVVTAESPDAERSLQTVQVIGLAIQSR